MQGIYFPLIANGNRPKTDSLSTESWRFRRKCTFRRDLEVEAARVEAARIELLPKLLERPGDVVAEQMLDDAHLPVVVERQVDVVVRDEVHGHAGARRAVHGEAERAVTRGKQEELRREHRPGPLLRIAEEAPRPLPRLQPSRGELGQLALERIEPRRHQIEEDTALKPQRGPVELVMGDETFMLPAARAREQDAKDGRMGGPRQPFEPPERRERDVGLAMCGAREREPPGQRVVHVLFLIGSADGETKTNDAKNRVVRLAVGQPYNGVTSSPAQALDRRSGVDERVQLVLRESLAAAEERELDDEAATDDLAAEPLDELRDRLDRSARCEHVVVNEHACAATDHLSVQLERVLSVLERVGGTDGLGRQLAGPAGGDEPTADLARDRSAEDEAARLRAEHEVGVALLGPRSELLDRLPQRLRIGEQRHDVLEDDARLREVGDVANLLGEIHVTMLTQRGAAYAGTRAVPAPAHEPRAPRGPRSRRASVRGCASAAPARRSPRAIPPRGRPRCGTPAGAAGRCRSGQGARRPRQRPRRARRSASRRPPCARPASRTPPARAPDARRCRSARTGWQGPALLPRL